MPNVEVVKSVDESTTDKQVATIMDDDSKKIDQNLDDDDDVPEDFFDDFSNNDFLAGLDVVDAWEDGPAGKLTEKRQPVAIFMDDSEKRSVSRERVFKTAPKHLELEQFPVRKPVKERLGEKVPDNYLKNEDDGRNKIGSNAINRKSYDSEISKKGEDEIKKTGGNDKEAEKPSRRSKTRDFNGRIGRRSRSKNRRSPLEEKWRSNDRRTPRRSKDRRSRSRGRRSKSPFRRESSDSRRDPSKTKRDIQRDKVKCAKDKEAKIISEKLRVVETGLVPPGTEMEVDIEAVIEKPPKKRTRSRTPEHYRRSKYMEKSPPSPRLKRRYRSPSPVRRAVSPGYRSRFYRRSPSLEHEPRTRNDKRFAHRSKERSPVKKKPSFLEELDEKLNVQAAHIRLEQIKEKINGGPISKPVTFSPRPVPCPNQLPIISHPIVNQAPPFQPGVYDEQFFIGPPNPEYVQAFPSHPRSSMQVPPQFYNNLVVPVAEQVPQKSVETLFNDENISLSAFLSITARVPDESKTLDVQSKIKVITRCQESIKIMTEYTKPSGRFYYKGTMKPPEKTVDFTNVSPMKRTLPVRLNFTKRVKNVEEKPTTSLGLLLYKLGLKQPAKIIDNSVRINSLNQTTQTDSFKCEECEAKKKVQYVTTCVQTIKESSDFSCQVTEDNFLNTARSALKNIIKTQSLAALTPAQILSQLGGNKQAASSEKEVPKRMPGLMELDVASSDGGFTYSQISPGNHTLDYNRRNSNINQMVGYPRGNIMHNNFGPSYQQINNRPFHDPTNQFRRF